MKCMNSGLNDSELFDDEPFWGLPKDVSDICNKNGSKNPENEVNVPICVSCKCAKICRCEETINADITVADGQYLTMNIS